MSEPEGYESEGAFQRRKQRAIEDARMLETESFRQRFWDATAVVAPQVMAELFDPDTFATAYDGANEAEKEHWVDRHGMWPFRHVMRWCDRYDIDSLMLRLDAAQVYAHALSAKTIPDRVMVSRYADRLQHIREVGGIERLNRLPLNTSTPDGSVFIWNPLHEARKDAERRIRAEFSDMLCAAMDTHESIYPVSKGYVPEKRDERHFEAIAHVQFLHASREEVAQAYNVLYPNRFSERLNELVHAIGLTLWHGVRGPDTIKHN